MYVYQYQYKQHYKYHAIKCYEHFYVYCRWLQMSVESEQGTCIWNVIINRYLYSNKQKKHWETKIKGKSVCIPHFNHRYSMVL